MTTQDDVLEVASLDLDGRGVARRNDGKVVFIDGALPGERVAVRVTRRKNQWEQAETVAVLRESPQRVRPACPHFGLHAGACGGCKMQHLDAAAQVAHAVVANRQSLGNVQQVLEAARSAAESHAAAAEEVAASTSQTTASAQEVSGTAESLQRASLRVLGLIGEFRT